MTAPSLPKFSDEFHETYLDLALTRCWPGCTDRPEQPPPRTMNAQIARQRLLNHALVTMTAACEKRRKQHKRANGGRRAPRVGRQWLERALLEERDLLFLSRGKLHELLWIELAEAVRYAVAARRARRQKQPICTARHDALTVTLLRIDQLIEELDTISLGFPLDDVIDEVIARAWWYLTGQQTRLPADLWPPSLEGVYTTLAELLAGLGHSSPSEEYGPAQQQDQLDLTIQDHQRAQS
jgi:hypothetical protein